MQNAADAKCVVFFLLAPIPAKVVLSIMSVVNRRLERSRIDGLDLSSRGEIRTQQVKMPCIVVSLT